MIQGVHLELRNTDCIFQGVIFNYMGQNIRQKICIYWSKLLIVYALTVIVHSPISVAVVLTPFEVNQSYGSFSVVLWMRVQIWFARTSNLNSYSDLKDFDFRSNEFSPSLWNSKNEMCPINRYQAVSFTIIVSISWID